MRCRIGITTNPDERRAYWRSQHRTLNNWTILGAYPTRSQAQRAETMEAARRGCEAHQGGGGPEVATWYLYYFTY